MKNSWVALLGLILAVPAYAQEEPTPADEPVEVVPTDTPPADASAPAEAAPSEAAPAEASSESAPTEEASAEPSEPWKLYVGADMVNETLSVSSGTSGADFDSSMIRLRVGKRMLEAIGLEAQFGINRADDKNPGEVTNDSYYGLYVVPTATVFEKLELGFPVGYAKEKFDNFSTSSLAYGFNAELPLKAFGEFPDLRFTLGWMIYHQATDARVYGANFGVRYDFETAGFGNPFSGFGNFISGLWPFGGDEEAAPEQ